MPRSEEHTSELQSHVNLVCRLLLEKKKKQLHYLKTKKKTKFVTKIIHLRALIPLDGSRVRLHVRSFLSPEAPGTVFFFFFNDTATTEIYTLSLHDALPI